LLDSRKAIRAGGDRGAAVVPGDPDGSLLLTAISHSDPDLQMPPKKERLPDSVINDFKLWIQAGAADPRVNDPAEAVRPPVRTRRRSSLCVTPCGSSGRLAGLRGSWKK